MEEKKGINFLNPTDFEFEDFDEICVKLKDVKKGDVLYECESGENYELTVLTNPRRINDGRYCVVENKEGEKFEIFMSEKTDYPVNIFWAPRFLTKLEEKVVYIIF